MSARQNIPRRRDKVGTRTISTPFQLSRRPAKKAVLPRHLGGSVIRQTGEHLHPVSLLGQGGRHIVDAEIFRIEILRYHQDVHSVPPRFAGYLSYEAYHIRARNSTDTAPFSSWASQPIAPLIKKKDRVSSVHTALPHSNRTIGNPILHEYIPRGRNPNRQSFRLHRRFPNCRKEDHAHGRPPVFPVTRSASLSSGPESPAPCGKPAPESCPEDPLSPAECGCGGTSGRSGPDPEAEVP